LYTSPNIIRVIKSRRMKWADHVACMGKMRIYRILVGKPEGMRSLESYRCRLEDDIMDLREVGWEAVD